MSELTETIYEVGDIMRTNRGDNVQIIHVKINHSVWYTCQYLTNELVHTWKSNMVDDEIQFLWHTANHEDNIIGIVKA